MSIQVLLADDDKNWRDKVRSLLQARPEWQVVGEVWDGLEAVNKAEELKPDLLLLDISLPNLNGIEVARRVRQLSPNSKILFLSMDDRLDVVELALSAGAQDFVGKADAQTELLPAIDGVLQGKQFVSSDLKNYEQVDAPKEEVVRTDGIDPSRLVVPFRVEGSTRQHGNRAGFFVAAATALAAAVVVLVLYGNYLRPSSQDATQADQQVAQLKQQNSALTANLAQLNDSVVAQQREIQNLLAQQGKNSKAGGPPDNVAQARAASSSPDAQLMGESQNQQKLLEEARGEVERVNALRDNDQASLVAQQVRIQELSDKLRVASATLDMERQLAAAGKDVRELMVARQLHVIDVRDTDPNGNPEKAFGRVFLTEGKSLTFYAFDLNEGTAVTAKDRFQVWAVPEAGKNSPRSLGILNVDSEAQGRWVLKVDNPDLVKNIDSVFVTLAPASGGKQPSGGKMLYAYLGEANHP